MTPEDLLGELSIRIYEPPLSDMREDGRICNAADPVAVLMLILDFDTEVAMNGIDNFIGNSSGRYMRETITALQTIGAESQAALLEKILAVADEAGMTHDAIQEDRSGLDEFAITSFEKLHGDKWDAACDGIQALDEQIDYSDMLACAETYAGNHSAVLHRALGIIDG